MKEEYTSVTRKGQITVPVSIRKALGLAIGDRVAVSLEEDGQLRATLRPVRSVADSTFGALRSTRAPVTEEDVRQAAWEHAAERDTRSKRA
jgi:AbrB family looped-hinge helix DNA binding protein